MTSLTALGLTNLERAQVFGEVLFEGNNLLTLNKEQMRNVRGKELAVIL